MRVLQVIHQFPPFSSQGSETHCRQLAQALRRQGHDVGVFHISNTRPRRPWRIERGVDGELRIFHCIDGGEYSRTADWPNAFLRESFQTVLAEFAPEVVHFHHYLSLGDDLVGAARAAGATIVYTLHDYGLICPSNLLQRADGSLCGKCQPDFFQDCCPTPLRTSGGQEPLLRGRIPPLFRWRQFAANQRGTVARFALSGGVALAEWMLGRPETTQVASKKQFYLQATQRIRNQVHRFLAPSAFLRERFLRCGFPGDRVVQHRYGLAPFPRTQQLPAPDGRLRIGYIGAFHAHKGIEVLLRAGQRLAGQAVIHLHGSSFGSPVSEAHFRRITAGPSAGFVVHGRYENERLGEILGGLDAVVVPSVWYENSPLTIQEAQLAGVPVITSDEGGMAELVRDGIDGLRFRLGDAEDLHRVLARLVAQPELLQELRLNAPAVPTMEEQAAGVVRHYQAARSVVRS